MEPTLPRGGLEDHDKMGAPEGTQIRRARLAHGNRNDLSSGASNEAGAGDEARTRDPYLGKVVLYH